jgi:ribosomal-protein-alanine N-acetyltransferase
VFSLLDVERITAYVYAPNLASRRVLEKNGFSYEGTMKRAVYKDGRFYDQDIYALLRNGD